jgi:hypothetical protein
MLLSKVKNQSSHTILLFKPPQMSENNQDQIERAVNNKIRRRRLKPQRLVLRKFMWKRHKLKKKSNNNIKK